MAPPDGSGTKFGAPDPTTATEFMNDLINTTTSLWQDQLARWASAYQKMRQGKYDAQQLQADISRMWEPWFTLAAFPFQWGQSSTSQLPTLLLIVDAVAQVVGPFDVLANIHFPETENVTFELADLHQLGGSATFKARYVELTSTPGGNRLSVGLVNLQETRDATDEAERLEPGLFIGPVYFMENSTPRPVALLYVLVEKQEPVPQPT